MDLITTQELAKIANVSQSTISRSLNDSSEISPKTRQRIKQLAKEYGYVHRQRNKSDSFAKSKCIAVVLSKNFFSDYPNLYLDTLFNSLYSYINQKGLYSLVVADRDDTSIIDNLKDLISSNYLAGCIIVNREYNLELDKYFVENNIAHVYAQYFSRDSLKSMNIIDIDHHLGGYMATSHLISLGHRKIITITSQGSDYQERTNGCFEALKEAGIPSTNQIVLTCDHNYIDAYETICKHLSFVKKHTAIFAQSDRVAIGCINALMDNGITVPDDISVIGFDGLEAGEYCRPSLSTIHQPSNELAKMAVDRLIKLIERGDTKVMHTFITPALLLRNSTASVKINYD